MMMVLPLLLVTVLPKMMQDPDTKKEMEEIQAKMNVQNNINMPEASKLLTSFLDSGTPRPTKPKKRNPEGRTVGHFFVPTTAASPDSPVPLTVAIILELLPS